MEGKTECVWTELKCRCVILGCVWVTNWWTGRVHGRYALILTLCIPKVHNDCEQSRRKNQNKQTCNRQSLFCLLPRACHERRKEDGQFLWLDLRVWTERRRDEKE